MSEEPKQAAYLESVGNVAEPQLAMVSVLTILNQAQLDSYAAF